MDLPYRPPILPIDKQQKTFDISKIIVRQQVCISFMLHLETFFKIHILTGVLLVCGETEHPIGLGNPLALLLVLPLALVQALESW